LDGVLDGEIERVIIEGSAKRFAFAESDAAQVNASFAGGSRLDLLFLDVGQETQEGLRPSWLAHRNPGAPVNPKWKKVANKLRSITTAGAIAFHPDGAKRYVRDIRYTKGAKVLNDQGVAILPIAGIIRYKLGKPAA
jgi:hypothetical protein